jgi:hypothetical protein
MHRTRRQADLFFARNRFGHDAPLAGALWQVPARRFQRRVGALKMRTAMNPRQQNVGIDRGNGADVCEICNDFNR